MSGDVRLSWDNDSLQADISIEDNDLAQDGGLETSVIISLFTNRRLNDEDALPDGETTRGGFWADAFNEVMGDQTGSRLWTLNRGKATADIPSRAREYCIEALAWMLEDKVAESVNVEVEIADSSRLYILIEIKQPTSDAIRYRYDYNWKEQFARRAA